jgi:hypothetical protein
MTIGIATALHFCCDSEKCPSYNMYVLVPRLVSDGPALQDGVNRLKKPCGGKTDEKSPNLGEPT